MEGVGFAVDSSWTGADKEGGRGVKEEMSSAARATGARADRRMVAAAAVRGLDKKRRGF